MGALRVVCHEPRFRLRADLRERGEDVRIEDFAAIRAIETLDVRVLIGFAGLDVLQPYSVLFAPSRERMRDELRPVVTADGAWRAMDREQLLEHADDARAGQRRTDFYSEGFAVAFIQHVQRAEAPPVVEHIVHEVERPGVIELRWGVERLLHPLWKPALRAPRQVEPQRAIHAMYALPVPPVPIEPQAIEALPEAPARATLQFAREDILDGRVLECELRIHPLELRILGLEFAPPLQLRHGRPTVLSLPGEEGRPTDAVLAKHLRHRQSALHRLQDLDDLTLTELRSAHRSS